MKDGKDDKDGKDGEAGKGPAPVKIRSVKFNVLMNMILTSSGFIFPLVTIPYVSRVLGTTGTGAVSFAQSVAQYFMLVALLGMSYYGVRSCAEVRDDKVLLSKTVKELMIILLCSTSVVSAVYIACLFFVPQFIDERLLFMEFFVYVWLTSFAVEWFYQALEQYGYITLRSVVFKFVALVLMFIFVREQEDYVIYGAIVIFASCGSTILNLIRLHRLVDFGIKQKLEVRRHFKPMLWFAVASIASGMYIHADVVMLGFLGTQSMVGIYQLAAKIKAVLVSAVNSVGNVMLPRLSYYHAQKDEDASRQLIAKNLNFVMILGFAIIAYIAICSKQIVLIMGGPDFIDSAVPLVIISPAVMLSACNIVLANRFISNNLERLWATVNVIGLAGVVVSNLVLIPSLGVVGAAASITACEALMLVMRTYVCRDFLASVAHLIDPLKIVFSAAAAAAATVLVVNLLGISEVLFAYIAVAFAVYSVVYAAMLLALKERLAIDMFRWLWGKRCK